MTRPDLTTEHSLISFLLNDPQPLPEIFKFLSAQDFEDSDCAWIYSAFDATYSGMEIDTPVWLKKMFDHLVEATEEKGVDVRISLRGMADAVVAGTNAVTLARAVRKESLRRKMLAAVEAYSAFKVLRTE